jgi:hypothetical protein
MSKACKFCDTLNENEEEFCTNCGAKLPSFINYADDMANNIATSRKKRFNLNILWIFCIILAAGVLLVAGIAFFPLFPEDPLPDYTANIREARNLNRIAADINRQAGGYAMTIHTNPKALSLYLSSLYNPSLNDQTTFDPQSIPRFIINMPTDNFNLCSVIIRSKIHSVQVRLEFFFSAESGSWLVTGYKLGNLPVMTFQKDKLFDSVFDSLSEFPDLKTVLESNIDLQRSKSHIYIKLKKNTQTSDAADSSKSFFDTIKSGLKKASRGFSSDTAQKQE